MSVNFFDAKCQTFSDCKRFGLCDNPHPAVDPAYIDENNEGKWIAEVENEYEYKTTFTAIDHWIDIKREDGKTHKRCDRCLTYNSTLIFIELKERRTRGSEWVKDAEKQLRAIINYFEATAQASNYTQKKAYIANKEHPEFKSTQIGRMDRFFEETGYVLRVENRIVLE